CCRIQTKVVVVHVDYIIEAPIAISNGKRSDALCVGVVTSRTFGFQHPATSLLPAQAHVIIHPKVLYQLSHRWHIHHTIITANGFIGMEFIQYRLKVAGVMYAETDNVPAVHCRWIFEIFRCLRRTLWNGPARGVLPGQFYPRPCLPFVTGV